MVGVSCNDPFVKFFCTSYGLWIKNKLLKNWVQSLWKKFIFNLLKIVKENVDLKLNKTLNYWDRIETQ